MGWRDHALRVLARGLESASGEPVDPQVMVRVFERIAADPEWSARLDGCDEAEVRSELLALYEDERETG